MWRWNLGFGFRACNLQVATEASCVNHTPAGDPSSSAPSHLSLTRTQTRSTPNTPPALRVTQQPLAPCSSILVVVLRRRRRRSAASSWLGAFPTWRPPRPSRTLRIAGGHPRRSLQESTSASRPARTPVPPRRARGRCARPPPPLRRHQWPRRRRRRRRRRAR